MYSMFFFTIIKEILNKLRDVPGLDDYNSIKKCSNDLFVSLQSDKYFIWRVIITTIRFFTWMVHL